MHDVPAAPRLYSAMALLRYIHAPIVGFYYLAACAFSLCVLQKPKRISRKRRRGVLALATISLVAYITEVLYYFSRSIAEENYEPPKPAALRCLGSILIWSPIIYQNGVSKELRWHPYFGAFVLHFIFETTTCLIGGFSFPTGEKGQTLESVVNCIRAAVSLFLLLDSFAILITKHMEPRADEERQPLLGATPANGAVIVAATTTYGAVPLGDPEGDGEDDSDDANEHDAEIKAKRAKRLEEEGGWVGYLKAFLVFLPYLFPKDDWKVMGALIVRLIHMLQERALNLLTPRQLGIITNKLSESKPTMPWKDIGLWVFYSYINSYAGHGILDGIANLVITNYSPTSMFLGCQWISIPLKTLVKF
jgi:hypothetical protein